MEQALFVRFLENMITLCQSTLEEIKTESKASPRERVAVRREVPFNPETDHITKRHYENNPWLAWTSVDGLRKDSIITQVYESGLTGVVPITFAKGFTLRTLFAYRVTRGRRGAERMKFDLDRFRADYESGMVRVVTTDANLPRERPLNRQSSLIDMVADEPIGCEPVPESGNKELRFQALSEQLLAAVLRRDQIGIGDYRNLAEETGSNMAEIRQTLDRLASEPLNLLKRRATAVGPVYTPAE